MGRGMAARNGAKALVPARALSLDSEAASSSASMSSCTMSFLAASTFSAGMSAAASHSCARAGAGIRIKPV